MLEINQLNTILKYALELNNLESTPKYILRNILNFTPNIFTQIQSSE
jgi:hypothetical protein